MISYVPPVFLNSRRVANNQVGKSTVSGENGKSSGKDHVFVQAGGRGKLKAITGNPFVQCTAGFRDSMNGLIRKCLIVGAQMENMVMTENQNGNSLATKSQAVVDACTQGTGSGELKTANGNPSFQSVAEMSNGSVIVNQDFVTGSAQVGTSAVTENDGRSMLIDLSSKVRVQFGSGQPPRKPVKRVHWKEEELVSKANEDGSKVTGSGEVVTCTDRRRRSKRKERALRRIL